MWKSRFRSFFKFSFHSFIIAYFDPTTFVSQNNHFYNILKSINLVFISILDVLIVFCWDWISKGHFIDTIILSWISVALDLFWFLAMEDWDMKHRKFWYI